MTDEQTAAAIVAEHLQIGVTDYPDGTCDYYIASKTCRQNSHAAAKLLDEFTQAIVRALQAARQAPPGHIIDDAGVVRKVVARSIGPVPWPADVPWVHILRVAATCDEMKAGDIIKHIPTGETWTVAAVCNRTKMLLCCGWTESMAPWSDCELVESCDESKQRDTIRRVMEACGGQLRSVWARRNLEELKEAMR